MLQVQPDQFCAYPELMFGSAARLAFEETPAWVTSRPDPWDGLDEGEEPARQWWAIHTKPRAEKRLAEHLCSSRVPFFLPWQVQNKRYQRRVVTHILPLFPGYLFLYGSEDDRIAALRSNQIVKFLPVKGQEKLLANLSDLFTVLLSGKSVQPEPSLEPGTPVEITAGPFEGRRGVVIRRASTYRLVLTVDFLQQGASMEVDPEMIRLLPQHAASAN